MPLPPDSAPFPFGTPAPDAPLLPVAEGVVETLVEDRAAAWVVRVGSQTDRLGLVDLTVVLVIGVEQVAGAVGAYVVTLGLVHPRRRRGPLVDRGQHHLHVHQQPVRDSRAR